MKPLDLASLCTALGFAVVVIKGDAIPAGEHAAAAARIATLIAEFCRTAPATEAGDTALRYRMAAAIVAITRDTGQLPEPQDLMQKDFTRDEIERHWPMAMALAHVELNISAV